MKRQSYFALTIIFSMILTLFSIRSAFAKKASSMQIKKDNTNLQLMNSLKPNLRKVNVEGISFLPGEWYGFAFGYSSSIMLLSYQDSGNMFRTNNAGHNINCVGPNPMSWSYLFSSSQNEEIMMAGPDSAGQMYVSKSGDNSFQTANLPALTSPAYWSSIVIDNDGSNMFACNSNGVLYRSTDEGENWKRVMGSFACSKIAMDVNGQNVYMSTNNKVYISSNGGDSFNANPVGSDLNMDLSLIATNGADGTIVLYGGSTMYSDPSASYVFLSTDSGTTFTNITAKLEGIEGKWLSDFAMSDDGSIMFVSSLSRFLGGDPAVTEIDQGHVWRSTDSGQSFTSLMTSESGFNSVSTLNSGKNLTITKATLPNIHAEIWISSDSGDSWSEIFQHNDIFSQCPTP